MPGIDVAITERRTNIPILAGQVDLWSSEEHRIGVDLTDNPTESGNVLSDNAVTKRKELQMTGLLSDMFPIRTQQAVSRFRDLGVAPAGTQDIEARSAQTWNILVNLTELKLPIDIVTRLYIYRNMVITRVVAPVNERTGLSLRFTLDITEVLFAETEDLAFSSEDLGGPAADMVSQTDRGDVASPQMAFPGLLTP